MAGDSGPYTTLSVSEFNRLASAENDLIRAKDLLFKAQGEMCADFCTQGGHTPLCAAIQDFMARKSLGLKPGAATDV